jgi:hypothetical protein
MKALLETLLALDRVTKRNGFLENTSTPDPAMSSAYIIASSTVTNPDPIRGVQKALDQCRHARPMALKSACVAARSRCWKATGTPGAL